MLAVCNWMSRNPFKYRSGGAQYQLVVSIKKRHKSDATGRMKPSHAFSPPSFRPWCAGRVEQSITVDSQVVGRVGFAGWAQCSAKQ